MRELFSFRFVAAVLAVIGSFLLVGRVTGGETSTVETSSATTEFTRHIDLVTTIERFDSIAFAVSDGIATSTSVLTVDDRRAVTIVEGTPGVDRCSTILRRVGDCVLFADLLGEAVVWFEIAPLLNDGEHVEMPAVVGFDGDRALLANGLLLPHADVFTRRCDTEYASFVEMLADRGEEMVSWWSVVDEAITDVVCTS